MIPICRNCNKQLDRIIYTEFAVVPVRSSRVWYSATRDDEDNGVVLAWHDDGNTPEPGQIAGYEDERYTCIHSCPYCDANLGIFDRHDNSSLILLLSSDNKIEVPDELLMEVKL